MRGFHALAIFLSATPVMAQAQSGSASPPQTEAAPKKNVLEGNYLTVGGGAVYGPSYEGSNDYVAFVVPALQGRVAGVSINPRAGGVALDFVPDPKGAKIGLALGPVATYSANRNRHIVDPVVRAAGRLESEIAVGASGGLTLYRVTNHYDSLSATVDVKWDVRGARGGMQVSPSLTYITPLSKAMVVSLTASAKHVDGDYANYYYSVSAPQAAASGLASYRARSGWASAGATMVFGYSLSGDLRKGGFTLVAIASYSKLLNDARDTPYTSMRGSANQLMGGGGIAFTF